MDPIKNQDEKASEPLFTKTQLCCKDKSVKLGKIKNKPKTRMHSRRMRTAHSLTVSRSICQGPPAMHVPLSHMPPLPCMPSAMHTPCPALHPCHAHPLATHTPLPCTPPTTHCPLCGGGMWGYVWQGVGMAGVACMAGGMCGSGTCMAGGVPPGRYYEIQSISGRYASYWNAFLLFLVTLYVQKENKYTHAPPPPATHPLSYMPPLPCTPPPHTHPTTHAPLPRMPPPNHTHTHHGQNS